MTTHTREWSRSVTVRFVNHRRWHPGAPADCVTCAFTPEELAFDAPPLSLRGQP